MDPATQVKLTELDRKINGLYTQGVKPNDYNDITSRRKALYDLQTRFQQDLDNYIKSKMGDLNHKIDELNDIINSKNNTPPQ